MGKTAIEWTERTWNPIVGCSLQSPGCKRCYAMKIAGRLEAMGVPYYQGTTQKTANGFVWTGKVATNDHALMEPLRRRAPTTWFVNSMSDLFHPDVSEQVIDRIFVAMALCPQHTFQVLTKRADRMRAYAEGFDWARAVENCRDATGASMILKHSIADLRRIFGLAERFSYDPDCSAWPLQNVWLGVSVEDQKRADERVPELLATPAAIRWLSCEPLLGPVDLTRIFMGEAQVDYAAGFDGPGTMRFNINALAGVQSFGWRGLDWIVVGGESGPGARPMHPDWARGLRDQCAGAGVPFLFKQWGEWAPMGAIGADRSPELRAKRGSASFVADGGVQIGRPGKRAAGRLLDGLQHDGMPA
jgi:protein gp37